MTQQRGEAAADVFPRISYTESQKLPAAIKATGNDIKDVKAVVFGHLHVDHAGGLEHFVGTDVPIYVHEEEYGLLQGVTQPLTLPLFLPICVYTWKHCRDGSS